MTQDPCATSLYTRVPSLKAARHLIVGLAVMGRNIGVAFPRVDFPAVYPSETPVARAEVLDAHTSSLNECLLFPF